MASGDGTPRTYSIAADTAAGDVSLPLLQQDIDDAATITTAFSHFEQNGDVFDIYFAAALSGAEITALDGVVAAHDAAETSLDFRFAEENGGISTTLQTYQNALTLTPSTGLKKGVYLMSWTCELKVTASGALNSRVQTRFRVAGTTKNNTVTTSEEWQCHSGWDRYFANEGEKPSVTLDYRLDPGVGGNDTVEVRKRRIGIQYIGTN